ncbi:MAG: hypothetical protein IIW81_00545, partial [Oscillospiraceae bacterium]|nr:hypothetical protein [Oscillospiraceae bacterium]
FLFSPNIRISGVIPEILPIFSASRSAFSSCLKVRTNLLMFMLPSSEILTFTKISSQIIFSFLSISSTEAIISFSRYFSEVEEKVFSKVSFSVISGLKISTSGNLISESGEITIQRKKTQKTVLYIACAPPLE